MVENGTEELYEREGVWMRKNTRDGDAFDEVLGWEELAIGPADTVLDIGAHIGCFTRRVALPAGAKRVIAIEPEPRNFALLQKNCAAFGNVELLNVAVVALAGDEVPFFLSTSKTNTMSHSTRRKRGRPGILVKGARLEELIDRYEPTVIKIDVEGAEHELGLDQLRMPACVRGFALEIELPNSPTSRVSWWRADAEAILTNLEQQGFVATQPYDLDHSELRSSPFGGLFVWAQQDIVLLRES